mmetsp:Transcript_34203/g.97172  ORF Transcript_34203/g.97172 Transcript_34203/m.97172 type:complete len:360 (+) Transcript_34203:92-1171(+)
MGEQKTQSEANDDGARSTSEASVRRRLTDVIRGLRAEPWRAGAFTHKKRLQDAMRNHGSVELMNRASAPPGEGLVAVKQMPNRWMMSSAARFAEAYPKSSERPWFDLGVVRFLNEHKFPYACEFFGIFQDEAVTYVVSEFATEGDLFSWCDTLTGFGASREAQIRPLTRQMFSAVAWLHDLGICHRDLSLENILLQKSADSGSDGLQVKLIDFGMSTLQRHTCNEIRGKQSYQAPEMHRKDEDYDGFLTDVFALGVVIYCLASQDYPWQSTQPGGCQLFSYVSLKGFRAFLERRKLRKGSGERLIEVFTTPFVDLVAGLTALSPVERFTVGEQCWTQPSAPATQRTAVWDLAWLDDWST